MPSINGPLCHARMTSMHARERAEPHTATLKSACSIENDLRTKKLMALKCAKYTPHNMIADRAEGKCTIHSIPIRVVVILGPPPQLFMPILRKVEVFSFSMCAKIFHGYCTK